MRLHRHNPLQPPNVIFIWITLFLLGMATSLTSSPSRAEQMLSFDVMEEQSQDASIFTQGFTKVGDFFYYSSGLYGRSFLKKVNPAHPQKALTQAIPKSLFAEGSTIFNKELYFVTWKKGIAVVVDPETLQPKRNMRYKGEGWGLTHDGTHLIMSDGSAEITFRDPNNFKAERKITVKNSWRQYKNLNELEFAENAIWANVWQSSLILKINPKNGQVLAVVNLDSLVKKHSKHPQKNVLNGIAYDAEKKAYWVTGKNWPKRYLVRFKTNKS